MSKEYGRIIYVESIEEAKELIEQRKTQPTLQEMFHKIEEINEQIRLANIQLGFPDIIIVKGELVA